jgi:hypothetical protein
MIMGSGDENAIPVTKLLSANTNAPVKSFNLIVRVPKSI